MVSPALFTLIDQSTSVSLGDPPPHSGPCGGVGWAPLPSLGVGSDPILANQCVVISFMDGGRTQDHSQGNQSPTSLEL